MGWFKSSAHPTAADADPVGPIGGYRYPRGPMGQTGYPGSNDTVLILDQTPPHPTPISAQPGQLQSNPDEFYGGVLWEGPMAALPVQLPRERRWYPRVSQNTTATDQRNTTYFGGQQALPNGQDRYVYGGYRCMRSSGPSR